jgi:cell division transport system ATP-binding protein
MIKFINVTKIYPPNVVALKNINLDIKAGDFVSIVGHSGAGKSTIAKLIIAEEKPTSGEIIVGGWNITHITPPEIPVLRRQIGMVFQDFKLLPQKTAFENVAFALEVCGASNKKIKKVVKQVLKIVGLENKMDRFPRQLSGGEQQRVVIARALVHRPKIILADEPTGNLDAITAQGIIDLLVKINKLGASVLLFTHNMDIVNSLKRRVITLDHGMIIADQEKGRYIL